ncbi:MAG: hypothetical protein ACKOYC_09115 [Bacteroidota bacterium]
MTDAFRRFATWSEHPKTKRKMVVGIISYCIVFYFIGNWFPIPDFQSRQKTTGLAHHLAEEFVYFQYYLGLFPVATLSVDPGLSKAAALAELEKNGENLVMEVEHWSRLGEHARIWAYMPNAWLRGSPKKPSVRLFNTLVFLAALLVLYLGFHAAGQPFVGTLLTLMCAFTPYFIYELFGRQNVFGLLGAGFFLILGLHAKSIFVGSSKTNWIIITVVAAILVGFLSEIRNETIILLASLFCLVLFAKQQHWFFKIGLLMLAFISVTVIRNGIKTWFDGEFEEAKKIVARHGGHVYNGPRIEGHRFWHPVFCGLGDFDQTHGYRWDDETAYRYAVPILNEKYRLNIRYEGGFHTENYYDADSMYYVKFDEIAQYEEVVKEKVIDDITNDPWWYLTILLKRVLAIMSYSLPIPFAGWLVVPAFVLMWKGKRYEWISMLLASLALVATPLLIYSGDGATYNALFGFISTAFIAVFLVERKP